MRFEDLLLAEPLLRAVRVEGYTLPTPIQAQAIPHLLAGRDLLGCAQTGTGKTAAFALPILHRLHAAGPPTQARKIRVLVLSPTRELAVQIAESFQVYGRHTGLRQTVVYGGVNQNPQTRALRAGIDILVATPGRLLDLIGQGFVDLRAVQVLVLDEADRMLDMGFIHDIRKIVEKIPAKRQTLLFSATMPSEIRQLADSLLRDPVRVEVVPHANAVEAVEQAVYFVAKKNKPELLRSLLDGPLSRTLVFTRTKHGADRVVRQLSHSGIRAEAIHGDKTQANRQRALANFKSNKTFVLVATDIAARGLDIDNISHVYNYDVPHEAETYVHRIGRTGRAGATGIAVSFCDPDERAFLKSIERLIRKVIAVRHDHPVYTEKPADDSAKAVHAKSRKPAAGSSGNGSGRPRPAKASTEGNGGGGQAPRSNFKGKKNSRRRYVKAC